jgi:hypothetical protein
MMLGKSAAKRVLEKLITEATIEPDNYHFPSNMH